MFKTDVKNKSKYMYIGGLILMFIYKCICARAYEISNNDTYSIFNLFVASFTHYFSLTFGEKELLVLLNPETRARYRDRHDMALSVLKVALN